MKKFFRSLVRDKVKLTVLIIILAVAGYFAYRHFTAPAAQTRYVTAQASKQTIVVSVSGTGQVSQDHTVNITPQTSGKLTSVNVKQGDKVKAGQTIAIVDETNNTIALNQARAALASAQANLAAVQAGSTPQDIQLAQLAIAADQQSITNASTSLQTTKQQDITNVANALSTLLNSTPQAVPSASNTGTGAITITGNYMAAQQGTYTISVYTTGTGQNFTTSGLETAAGPVRVSPPVALGANGLYVSFSGKPNGGDSWTITTPNTLATNYVSNYNAYQSALTTQANDIINGQNQIASAQNKLQQDQVSLQVKQLPPTDQALQSAQASLTNAQAQLQNAQIAYNNNILTAPFDSQLAQLNSQVGDQVSASTVVAVVTNNQSQAVIPLNEVDVASVKTGDKATMTFDAISDLTLTGTVVQIDNIGTVSQGVVNYNVKVAFDVEDPRVKAGMSVNVAVITDTQPDVLTIPSSAIKTSNNNKYVLVLDPAQTQSVAGQTGVTTTIAPKQVSVQTGATDGTNTQIISGLSEGDTVVTQTISSAKTTTAASSSVIPGLGGGAFRAGGAAVGRPGG